MTVSTRYLPATAAVAAVVMFAASPVLAGADTLQAHGALTRYSDEVPPGARASVAATYDSRGDSRVRLRVWGLAPRTRYAADVHERPCGTTAAEAGRHFQNVPGPADDRASTNPGNQVWLDFRTDARGRGRSRAEVPWQFAPEGRPGSVIIHVERTYAGIMAPGIAGARLACLTVGF